MPWVTINGAHVFLKDGESPAEHFANVGGVKVTESKSGALPPKWEDVKHVSTTKGTLFVITHGELGAGGELKLAGHSPGIGVPKESLMTMTHDEQGDWLHVPAKGGKSRLMNGEFEMTKSHLITQNADTVTLGGKTMSRQEFSAMKSSRASAEAKAWEQDRKHHEYERGE